MTPTRSLRKRPYLTSGMHRRTPPSPEVLQAMAAYRAELVAHRGGEENITATVRSKIEIAVAVRFRRLGVEAYIQTIYPIDKRHRRVWPAMTDLMRLEAHELAILRDLGDVPKTKDVSLDDYIAELEAEKQRKAEAATAPIVEQEEEADADHPHMS
jgi:hypothetical protein